MNTVTLGELCSFVNGGAWSDSDYCHTGIPVLKVSNCKNSGFSLSEISYLSHDLREKYKQNKLQIDDIIIATVGSHPQMVESAAGRSCIVTHEVVGYYLNQNAVCIRTVNPSVLDQKYLFYLSKTKKFMHYIQNRGKGAANQMRIAIGAIKDYTLELPRIVEQRRIVAILSAYDDLIENNQEQIKLLEEAAQRLYKEWFVDLRFPGWENTKIVDRVPEGWERLPLSSFADIVMGQSPKSEFYNTTHDGIPFHQGVGSYGKCFVVDNIFSNSYTRIAEAGSILFSVRAPVGRLNITKNKIAIGRGLAALNHKKGYQSFLFYLLKDRFFKDDLLGNGSIFASISKNELYNQVFIVPNNFLANQFNIIVSNIDRKISIIDEQLNRLVKTRDRLLSKLMNAETEV